jgi:hypothetical protein
MRAPPSFYVYQGSGTFLLIGMMCLVAAPFQRSLELAALGVGALLVAIPFMVAGAVWRNSYNKQSDDGGLTDHHGFPIPRVELVSDALATWVVRLVWPTFLREGSDGRSEAYKLPMHLVGGLPGHLAAVRRSSASETG